MAAALMHEPETLFLDEPTSGADPLARREFWRRITALSAQGVTVVVTTHFMEEAEYCDRIAIMDAGKVLAQGTPAEIRQPRAGRSEPGADYGRCFYRDRGGGPRRRSGARDAKQRGGMTRHTGRQNSWRAKSHRSVCLIRKEARQIVRDPSSIAIGIVLPVVLILLFGYGLSLDVTDSAGGGGAGRSFAGGNRTGGELSTFALLRRAPDDFDARGAEAYAVAPSRWHCPHPAGFFARLELSATPRCKFWCMGSMPITLGLFKATRRGAVGQWQASCRNARSRTSTVRPGGGAKPALVQRSQRKPLFSGSRPDRFDHDADRRLAHGAGDGARMGTRHARSAVRHAGAHR